MMNSQDSVQGFVEAHYYPNGKKTYHASLTDGRPAWAPPSEGVGFSQEDNIDLNQHDLVVEFERMLFSEKRLTWCAVYCRSTDETVGDRRQYAGVGLWLSEYQITNFPDIIECLRQLLTLVSGKFDSAVFEHNAKKFLKENLPKSVELASKFPDFLAGIPFAQITSSKQFVTDCKTTDTEGNIRDAANHLTYLSVGHDVGTYSRALIHIPVGTELPVSNEKFGIITRHDDKLSKIISELPKALGSSASKVKNLEAELKDAQSQNVELQASLVEKNEEVHQLETKVAALQAEIDASVQKGVSIPILSQLKLSEQNIIAAFQKYSGPVPQSQYTPPEKRGPPSPYVSTIQNPGTRNKIVPHPYGDPPKNNRFFWPLLAFSAFAIACAIGIALWLMDF